MTDLRLTDDSALRRYLGEVFAEEVAATASPRHLDQIISATGRVRPLPRWLALLKEPPMRLNTRVAAGAPGRRLAIALAVVLALTVAAVAAAMVLIKPEGLAAEWSGFRGGPDRAGFAAEGPVGNPVVAWQVTLGGPPDNVSVSGDLAIVAAHDG